jgi:hypothetical protein
LPDEVHGAKSIAIEINAPQCVISAIHEDFAVLAWPSATDEQKPAALKFLGHRVGDIHQPLHAASRDDRAAVISGPGAAGAGACTPSGTAAIVEERLGMHPLAIVPELRAGISDEQRARWLASNPADVASDGGHLIQGSPKHRCPPYVGSRCDE